MRAYNHPARPTRGLSALQRIRSPRSTARIRSHRRRCSRAHTERRLAGVHMPQHAHVEVDDRLHPTPHVVEEEQSCEPLHAPRSSHSSGACTCGVVQSEVLEESLRRVVRIRSSRVINPYTIALPCLATCTCVHCTPQHVTTLKCLPEARERERERERLSSPPALLLAARRGSGLGVCRLAPSGCLYFGLERGEAAGGRGGQWVLRPRVPRVAPRLHRTRFSV